LIITSLFEGKGVRETLVKQNRTKMEWKKGHPPSRRGLTFFAVK